MTRLAIIGCTHNRHDEIKIPECDILIHTGDWSNSSTFDSITSFLKWFESHACHKVFINGNHEIVPEKNPELFLKMIEEYAPNSHYLHDSGVELCGLKFWGSPYTPRFFDWAYNENRGENLQRHWDMIPDDTQVLVTHGPPHGILDQAPRVGFSGSYMENTGCENLRQVIDSRLDKLRLHAYSHIHCSFGRAYSGNKIFANVSMVNEKYRIKNPVTVIDL